MKKLYLWVLVIAIYPFISLTSDTIEKTESEPAIFKSSAEPSTEIKEITQENEMVEFNLHSDLQPLIDLNTKIQNNLLPILLVITSPTDSQTKEIIANIEPTLVGKIDVIKLDTQENNDITRYIVSQEQQTPFFSFIKNGTAVLPIINSALSKEDLQKLLDEFVVKADQMNIEHANQLKKFEQNVLQSPKPVFLYFTATWCPPCQKIKPIIEEVFEEYKDKIKCLKFDLDENKVIANSLSIKAVPTFIFLNQGQELYRFLGATSKNAFRDVLDILLKKTITTKDLDDIVQKGTQELRSPSIPQE